jgi:hypothetical protein
MSDEDKKRKEMFAALSRVFERERQRVDREMPGATEKEKSEEVARRISDAAHASRDSARTSTDRATLEQLISTLRGKKLQREENQSDRDYSGGGFYSEMSDAIYLFADRTFRKERRVFSSISGGGLSRPSESMSVAEGRWTVEMVDGAPHLVLRSEGSVIASWRTRDGGVGVQYLDGVRWGRYKM